MKAKKKLPPPLRVVVLYPGKEPDALEIPNTTKGLQAVVEGVLCLTRWRAFDVWVNDNGIALGMPLNRVIGGVPLFGPIVFSKTDAAGEAVSLTDNEVALVLSTFGKDGAS